MLELTFHDRTAVLTLSHGKVNALDLEFCSVLNRQLNQLKDDSCRAVVLTGVKSVFSAGVDLVRLLKEPVDYLDAFLPELVALFEHIFLYPKPIVAAVNGHAVAGGCIIVCACDYRVISRKARIGVPELRVGVPFPSAGLEIMRSAATPRCFRKIINIGATYTGQRAVEAGLADESIDPDYVMETTMKAAEQLAEISPQVFQLTKRNLRRPVMEQIIRGNEIYGDEINRLWRDEKTRKTIAEYVAVRLKGKEK